MFAILNPNLAHPSASNGTSPTTNIIHSKTLATLSWFIAIRRKVREPNIFKIII